MARGAKRAKRRLACRLVIARQRFSGVILDLSASGIFVQTHAKPRPGDAVSLELSMPGQRQPLRVEAQVARLKLVPPRLMNVAQGGLGLRITNAPEGYFAFLASILPELASPASESEEEWSQQRRIGNAVPPAPPKADAPSKPVAPAKPPVAAKPVDLRRRYRVHVSLPGGARSRTLHIQARSPEEAAALAFEETGEGWKLLEATLDEDSRA